MTIKEHVTQMMLVISKSSDEWYRKEMRSLVNDFAKLATSLESESIKHYEWYLDEKYANGRIEKEEVDENRNTSPTKE